MGWFRLLWTILFAASVSCQQLTTVLPRDDDACMRNEVAFNCTVTGSLTLTDLILAWSSPEYIGQGNPLRFTTQDTLGANKTSMINENVTAILISNMRINRVPELVSELHVIGASQTSVITCSSESNQTSVSTTFVSSAFPGRPQIREARERSASSCDFLVTWDPPTNIEIFDIGRYIIYVPSRNMMNVSSSTTIDLTIPNCRVGNNSIQVAAVNRFGCIGPNSSHTQLSLMEMQDPPSDGLSAPVGGIVVGVFVFFVICLIIALVVFRSAWKANKRKHKSNEQKRKKRESDKKKFILNLSGLYDALEQRNEISTIKEAVHQLLRLMKEIPVPSTDVKEALKKVLETKFTSAKDIWNVLVQLKLTIPAVIQTFDTELDEVGSVTVSKLITAARNNEHEKPLDELKKQVDKASPEDVKDHLQKLFEALHVQDDSSDSDEEAYHVHPRQGQTH